MKIRYSLALLLALLLTACLAGGCGSKPAETDTVPSVKTAEETGSAAEKTTEAPDSESTAAAAESEAPEVTTEAGTALPETTAEAASPAETIPEETTQAPETPEETVPEESTPKETKEESPAESGEEAEEKDLFTFEKEEFRFAISGMEKEETWLGERYVLRYRFENLSDKTLRLYGENMNVNGYMVGNSIFEDAGPGETLEEDLRFYAEELKAFGAEAPDQLSFRLRVRDAEDYLAEPVTDETVTLFPTGKKAEDITPAARPEAEGEIAVLDEEDFAFVILDRGEDSWYGKEYRVYLENNTDRTLYFTWDSVGVNGWNADPYWGFTVAAHARALDAVSFSKEELAENGLTSLDEIRFTLRISDPEDYTAEDLHNETYTVYPTGLEAEDIVIPDRPTAETEKEILDTDELTLIILDEKEDGDGRALRVFFENKTETDLMFSFRDLNINGVGSEASWARRVPAGLRSIARFTVENDFFTESGKSQIESLDFKLRVYDPDDYKADDLVKPTEYSWEP